MQHTLNITILFTIKTTNQRIIKAQNNYETQ